MTLEQAANILIGLVAEGVDYANAHESCSLLLALHGEEWNLHEASEALEGAYDAHVEASQEEGPGGTHRPAEGPHGPFPCIVCGEPQEQGLPHAGCKPYLPE